ncbi:MAG: O-antigen ligase family protein, partial [Vicinamibacterales bacterium]
LLALLGVLLYSLTQEGEAHVTVAVALAAFAACTAAFPAWGFFAVAAAVPIATSLVGSFDGTAWPEALVIAFLAGWTARGLGRDAGPVRRSPGEAGSRTEGLSLAAVLFALVVVAALVVEVWLLYVRLDARGLAALLWTHVSREFFAAGTLLPELHTSALMLEGLALFAIALALARRDARFPDRAIRCLAGGATAAAAVNIYRLVESAWSAEAPLPRFLNTLWTQRYNEHYPDLNAAGSYFAMLLCVAAGLALSRRWVSRRWIAPVAALAAALWISGSRAAYLSLCVGIVATAVWWLRRGRARFSRRSVAAIAAALLMAAAAITMLPTRGNQHSSLIAVRIRAEMVRAGLRMAADYPLFGLGPGQFYRQSGDYASPALLAEFPVARNENAHNNFVQILAEFGLAGLAAFLLILLGVSRRVARALDQASGPVWWGTAAGLLVFLISCLGGHPLLIRDVAYAFWMLLGVLAGHTPVGSPASRRARQAVIAVALVLAASLPFRANARAGEADLEHVGIGLSPWQPDIDGVRYRTAGASSSIFIPARGRGAAVPLRLAPQVRTPLRVEIFLDGRLANVVTLVPDTWVTVRLVMPDRAEPPRFWRVDLRVRQPPNDEAMLLVGKVAEH